MPSPLAEALLNQETIQGFYPHLNPRGKLAEALAKAGAEPSGQRSSQFDWLDKGFLSVLRGAEGLGISGTPLKLFNDVVQRERKEPITERDFSPEELSGFRQMIAAKGTPSGHIDYDDYKATDVSPASIGGFNYETGQDGATNITDTYDFNTNRGHPVEKELWARLLTSVAYPPAFAATIGRKAVPPGTGVPVRMRLDPNP